MSLLEFHYFDDGRPVSFDQYSVIHIEGHESGEGTLVRLGPIDRPFAMHLREQYDLIVAEVRTTEMQRAMKSFVEGETDEDLRVPF